MKRKTIQRSLILDAVQKLQCHPTAEQIYDEIAAKHKSISKGTVYRNLSDLAQNGDIAELAVPGSPMRFDHCCDEHYHARCLCCGRVFDVNMDIITSLDEKIKNKNGFEFTGYDIIFKGVCAECRKKTDN